MISNYYDNLQLTIGFLRYQYTHTSWYNRKNYKGELLTRHGNEIEVMVDNIKFTIDIDSIDICRIVPKFK